MRNRCCERCKLKVDNSKTFMKHSPNDNKPIHTFCGTNACAPEKVPTTSNPSRKLATQSVIAPVFECIVAQRTARAEVVARDLWGRRSGLVMTQDVEKRVTCNCCTVDRGRTLKRAFRIIPLCLKTETHFE